MRNTFLRAVGTSAIFLALLPSPAASQTPARKAAAPDCAQGVIRLPNQAGTIQICSGFASKIPQLAVQLNEVSKRLGAQQQQIAELNRLIRGLNSVSGVISPELQETFLQNFSAELEQSQSKSDAIITEQFRALSERIEELQSQMISQISAPEKSAALSDALKGELGTSISKLEFGSALRQLKEIDKRLSNIENSVAEVKVDTTTILSKVNSLDENGKKLARQGERSLELLQNVANDFVAISNLGGLVAKPVSIAEKYNNARVLAQRGEVDLALSLYKELMVGNLQFADVAADFTALLDRIYGRKGAISYIEKEIKPQVPFAYYLYANELITDDAVGDEKLGVIHKALKADPEFVKRFPPLAHRYLSKISKLSPSSNGLDDYDFGLKTTSWLAIFDLSKRLTDSINSGAYRSYFIDQLRSSTDVERMSAIPKSLLTTPDELMKECREPFEGWDFFGHACSAVGVERKQSTGRLPFGIVNLEKTSSNRLKILEVNFDMLKSAIFAAKGQFSLDLYQIENGVPKSRFDIQSVEPLVYGFNASESKKIIQNSPGNVIYPLAIPTEAHQLLLCIGTMHPIYNRPYKVSFLLEESELPRVGIQPADESICLSNGKILSKSLEPIDSISGLDWKVYSHLSNFSDEKLKSIDSKVKEEICRQITGRKYIVIDDIIASSSSDIENNLSDLANASECSREILKSEIKINISRSIQRANSKRRNAAILTKQSD